MKTQNIGRVTSLQTLRAFVPTKEEGCEFKQLGNLDKLSGSLRIDHLENVESQQEALEARLVDKEMLRELELYWGEAISEIFHAEVDSEASSEVVHAEVESEASLEVLEGLCPPTCLETLYIWGYKGLRYPSWMLGKHNGGPEYLKCLSLGGWVVEPVPELRGFFTHLRRLTIWDCSWQALPDCIEQLASLQSLHIFFCMNIQSFPTLPQSVTHFTLLGCNEVLMSSCKCETIRFPYWQKIQHIPRAEIGECRFKMGVCTEPGHTTTCKDDDSSASEQARHRPPKRKFKCRTKKEERETIASTSNDH